MVFLQGSRRSLQSAGAPIGTEGRPVEEQGTNMVEQFIEPYSITLEKYIKLSVASKKTTLT